ncbi:MAG TPA: aspartate ammonia-lyase [Candidatus Krumholzibacteria bacterium]|nr:aspartate ammonia-lyase [Candidatus Krumholzibacteria bacterium]
MRAARKGYRRAAPKGNMQEFALVATFCADRIRGRSSLFQGHLVTAREHIMNTYLHGSRRGPALVVALALVGVLAVPKAPSAQTAPSTKPKAAQSAASPKTTAPPRIEKDLLGPKEIPAEAYYGVQTARALENFQISGVLINHYPGFVEAWAMVKLAAARANTDVGAMKKERLAAIEKACQAVLDGKYHDQFLVDWYQGGAGTSTNMNANEVLANIALELSGHKKGEYQYVEPHDDLNMSQSTNDSYPTAIKVAFLLRNDKLIQELQKLVASFRMKGDAFLEIVKMGRTEMQDAVPMTVGQEFHAFAASLEDEIKLLRDSEKYLYAVNMGATAIGTAINVPKGYPEKCAAHLAKLTGKPIVPASDMIAATWDQQGFVVYSAALKSLAIKLSKISSDLILLTSGPRAGLFEIKLPAMQPGSSIMPGKVNPVMPELMNIVAFRVMGNDYSVTLAAHSGQLQLNAYEPLEGLVVIESQALLYNASMAFRTKCIDGITVNEQVLAHYLETTVGIVTALNPVLGYEKATELADEAYKSGKGVLEIIREKKILTEQQIKELLDPVKLSGLDKSKYPKK